MVIDFIDFEKGVDYDGDYDDDLSKLIEWFVCIQVVYIGCGKSVIIVFEGWDVSGKGGVI